MNPIKFKSQCGNEYDIIFVKETYNNNGRLYIGCWYYDEECGGYLPYCDVTVNLLVYLPDGNYGFLDVNNGDQKLFELMARKNFFKETDICGHSGRCTYPAVEFTEEFLNMIETDENNTEV